MNCKPGDLAIIVRSLRGNDGCIVECVFPFPSYKGRGNLVYEPCWGIRGRLRNLPLDWEAKDYEWCRSRGFDFVIRDAALRPLRDNPDEDETLQWAGHPKTAEIRKGVEMLEKLKRAGVNVQTRWAKTPGARFCEYRVVKG